LGAILIRVWGEVVGTWLGVVVVVWGLLDVCVTVIVIWLLVRICRLLVMLIRWVITDSTRSWCGVGSVRIVRVCHGAVLKVVKSIFL
jgi:hypothetical protein